jgi:PIN domain nuclease of toxin-antitoxin system
VRVLLDTHTLLWWLADDAKLSAGAVECIDDPKCAVLVSAASAWEICTKYRNGKLPTAKLLSEQMPLILRRLRFEALPISLLHAQRAGLLEGQHKDPFDRMLAAQALIEDIPLVTNDAAMASFGVKVMW